MNSTITDRFEKKFKACPLPTESPEIVARYAQRQKFNGYDVIVDIKKEDELYGYNISFLYSGYGNKGMFFAPNLDSIKRSILADFAG